MFKRIAATLAGVVTVFLVVAAQQPDEFRVSRSTVIAAPVASVFAQVNDLHQWETWSPWAKLDPQATITYSGPQAGKDASMQWDGNRDVGKGTMTIVYSRENERIDVQLLFEKPMRATNHADFVFAPDANGTRITWTMTGTNDFPAKAIGLLMNCEKMVGEQFEKGLLNLKTVVETRGR